MSEEKTYVIIYKSTHKHDVYYEDPNSDYGNEQHYLEGKTSVNTKEVVGFSAMQKECEEIGEANADNPPYDEYHVVCVYEKDTKEDVPKSYWYPDHDVADAEGGSDD